MKLLKIFCIVIVIALFFSKITTKVESLSGCLTAGFYVEDTFYNFFDPTKNSDSIQTFDQWIAKEMTTWTQILQSSAAKDCFQVGEIVRVADGTLPSTNHPKDSDRTVDVIWGFPATELSKDSGSLAYWTDKVKGNTDWGLLHELGHARYLIDEYGFDIPNSTEVVQVTDPNGISIVNNYIIPASAATLYFNKANDMMSNFWSQHFYGAHDVGALNLIAGQHLATLYGNYNSPSDLGVFLNNLSNNNVFRILDNASNPIAGAGIRIFDSVLGDTSKYAYAHLFDNIADFTGATDFNGLVSVGHNPFGGSQIDQAQLSNVDLILEVSYNNAYYYKIIEVSDFNLAYWAGATNQATYDIATTLGASLPTTPTPIFTPSGSCAILGQKQYYCTTSCTGCASNAGVGIPYVCCHTSSLPNCTWDLFDPPGMSGECTTACGGSCTVFPTSIAPTPTPGGTAPTSSAPIPTLPPAPTYSFPVIPIKACDKLGGIQAAACNLGKFPDINLGNVIQAALNILFIIGAVAAIFFIIYGGTQWITSSADKQKVDRAKHIITTAVLGLIIMFLSFLIINLIGNVFGIGSILNFNIPTLSNPNV